MDLSLWFGREFLQRLPNYLTFLRLALVPVFVIMLDPNIGMVGPAVLVFMIASFTDYFDGYIARRYGAISDVGKLLDPLADKLLVTAALVMLVAQSPDQWGQPWVPGWMVVMVLAREIWVTGLRGVAASKGIVVAAGNAGKVKSVLQMMAIVGLLCNKMPFPILYSWHRMTMQVAGLYLLLLSIIFSYWGAVEYTYFVLKAVFVEEKAGQKSEAGTTPTLH